MLDQDATASTSKTTSDTASACGSRDKQQDDAIASISCAQERSDQGWVTRFLKGDHDLLWPSGPIASASPTLLTGLTTDSSDQSAHDPEREKKGLFRFASGSLAALRFARFLGFWRSGRGAEVAKTLRFCGFSRLVAFLGRLVFLVKKMASENVRKKSVSKNGAKLIFSNHVSDHFWCTVSGGGFSCGAESVFGPLSDLEVFERGKPALPCGVVSFLGEQSRRAAKFFGLGGFRCMISPNFAENMAGTS